MNKAAGAEVLFAVRMELERKGGWEVEAAEGLGLLSSYSGVQTYGTPATLQAPHKAHSTGSLFDASQNKALRQMREPLVFTTRKLRLRGFAEKFTSIPEFMISGSRTCLGVSLSPGSVFLPQLL